MSSESGSRPQFNLWMERGFSRQEIASRMLNASSTMKIYSAPEQPLAGSETLAYPSLATQEGIETFNGLVAQHGIDAAWPQKSAKFDLSGLACDVHVAAAPEVLALVDDKSRFTDWLSGDPYQPDATEVVGSEAAAAEYALRNQRNQEVCIKPVRGINGDGYWKLTESPRGSFLDDPDPREIHPDVYFHALAQKERNTSPDRMMVMEWLPGPEVSVDLLCWRGKPLIHAARTKLGEKRQRIQSEHPVIEHARALAGKLALHGIISVQYRLDKDKNWKILEVNPRPAGGSINSDDAGFGIIKNWAALVSGEAGPEGVKQHNDDVLIVISRLATLSAFTPDLVT